MRFLAVGTGAVIVLAAVAATARAANVGTTLGVGSSSLFSVMDGYSGYYSPHASTLQEGFLRGLADMARSEGVGILGFSEAAINFSEARSRELDNAKKYVQTYFDRRRMNQVYREAERSPRATPEQISRLAQAAVPQRLSPGEMDAASGRIYWPATLRTPNFSAQRIEIENLFTKRAASGGYAPGDYKELRRAAEIMLEALQDRIYLLPSDEYLAARRFVESLSFEARFPPPTTVGAR
jgi:hypothetical protein